MNIKRILTASLSTLVLGGVAAMIFFDEPVPFGNLAEPFFIDSSSIENQYAPSAAISDHSEKLYLTELGSQILRESEPEVLSNPDFDEACSGVNAEAGVGVLGCYYTGRDKIYVYDVTDKRLANIEKAVLAHEVLHAVWERMSVEEKSELNQELLRVFTDLPNGHPAVVRLQPYLDSAPESLSTELHSIIGTEAVETSPLLEKHYAKYFTDRQQVAREANDAYGVIDDMRIELRSLARQLILGSEELDANRAVLEQREIEVEATVVEFNRMAENAAFASESEYYRIRNEIEAEQEALSDDYEIFNEAVEAYNEDISRLENLNQTMKELNEEINIPSKR